MEKTYCKACGEEIDSRAALCPKCGVATGSIGIPGVSKSRMAYILLGLFLGGFGIHNFYAGRIGCAVTQLLITCFLFWLIVPIFIVWVWVLIEICTVRIDGKGNALV
jgi:TM2 domain-containing membrane protein YozV